MKKLLDLDRNVIKQLNKFAIDQDYRSVKAFMEDILTEAANPKYKNKLTEYENVYHKVLESLPQVVWIGTAKGEVTYLNPTWTKWTGRSVDDSLGNKWAESLHPDDVAMQLEKWESAYKHNKPYHGECRFVSIDGTVIYCAYVGVPVKNEQGKLLNWIGIDFDITARKHAELEMHNKIVELTKLNDLLQERDAEMKELKKLIEKLQRTIQNNGNHNHD